MINVIYNKSDYEISQRKMDYFDKYNKVIQWGRRNPVKFMELFFGLDFMDHQKYILLESWTKKIIVWLMGRNSGKFLHIETPIFTPNGVRPIKEIMVGDFVIDRFGNPTKVLAISDIEYNQDCYELTFEDGEKIIAGGTHSWYVNYKCRTLDEYGYKEKTTEEMYKQFLVARKDGYKEYKYSVPSCYPVQYSKKNFLIDPYLLGYWLGDGCQSSPQITCHKDDLYNLEKQLEIINLKFYSAKNKNRNTYTVSVETRGRCNGNGSFLKSIRQLNLYKNKHIPEEYFYGSYEQRLSLIQGLMDSDGSIRKDGHCEFSQTRYDLICQVARLLQSLGIKNNIYVKKARCNGKDFNSYRINFRTDINRPVFRLNRKKEKLEKESKIGVNRKSIIDIQKVNSVPVKCLFVESESHTYLCGNNYTVTHNSYLAAPYMMARSILIPNHKSYIMTPSGSQAKQTFSKIEELSKGQVKSIENATRIFFDEVVKSGASDGFIHDKESHYCELYNGSGIYTLNSVVKNIVGFRSNLNFYDEAGKIDNNFFDLTEPFATQDTNFVTGGNMNIHCRPLQLPNQLLYASSAEGVDSRLYAVYKECALNMIAGIPDYFACDIDCNFSLKPNFNGKPYRPLLDKSKVDNALRNNEYKANREYFNIFDTSGGQDALVKRTTILANSFAYEPVFFNNDGKTYIIAYDPSSKIDNSFVLIGELFRDEDKGWMVKLIYGKNFIEKNSAGDKKVIQKPEQIELIKEIILKFNGRSLDYDNLHRIIIDAGSGGGGFDISQFLLKDWIGSDKKPHCGLIDLKDKYLLQERYKFPSAIDKLTLANFTKDKVAMYTAAQDMINQGLVMFPKSLNLKGEIEFEQENEDNTISIIPVRMDAKEVEVLVELDLLKEELVAIEKTTSGTHVKFDLSLSKKSQNMHDDRADCCAMICFALSQLRKQDLLQVEEQGANFDKIFNHAKRYKNGSNPFKKTNNPFLNNGPNPFLR